MRIRCGLVLPLMLTALACTARVAPPTGNAATSVQTDPAAAATGVLAGSVVRGPTRPVIGIGGPSPTVPVAGAKLIVSRSAGGSEVASTSTDVAGRYQVVLPSGTYVVTLGSNETYRFTKDLPASVTVTQGQTTTLNVVLDTGVR